MSAPLVRFEVWKNGKLAARRCGALLECAFALQAELRALGAAGSNLPAFVENIAQRAEKAEGTRFDEYDLETAKEIAAGDIGVAEIARGDSALLGGNTKHLSRKALARAVKARFETFGSRQVSRMGNTYGASDLELQALIRDVDKLEAVVSDMTARVDEARRRRAAKNMADSLRTVSQMAAAGAPTAAELAAETRRQEARERRELAASIARIVDSLSPDLSDADRAATLARAQEAMGASRTRRGALLAQLRLDVQHANAAAAAQRQARRQVEQWRQRLLGLEGGEVEELDAALRQLHVDGVAPADVAQRVDDVVARATDAANREYALGVIQDELENLGYVVEVGFDTAASEAEHRMLLRSPEMDDDYLVAVDAAPGASFLRNEVVREAEDAQRGVADPDRQETDERMQRTWCQHLAKALAAAERRGVRGQARERLQPGEIPVPAIAPLRGATQGKGRRRRQVSPRSQVVR